MLKNILIPLIFQYILEAMAVIFNAYVFLKKEIKWKQIITFSCISGITTYLIRISPVSFVIHSVCGFLIIIIMLNLLFSDSIVECFIAVLKSFILLGIVELITVNLFVKIMGMDLGRVLASPFLKTWAVLPQNLILLLIGFIILKYRERKDGKKVVSEDSTISN